MIYLLTALGLTPGGSSTVHIYIQTVQQHDLKKQNKHNRTYITIKIHKYIRIHKHNNKNT
jgi:hypothetical protein